MKFLQKAGLFHDAQGLVAIRSGSALAAFPFPVLVADAQGRLSPVNPAANHFCEAVLRDEVPGLASSVARVKATGQAQVEVVMVPGAAGALLYELLALPMTRQAVLVIAKDVTLESNLRAALVESRQRYKDLVEISTDFAWEIGADGAFSFVSPRGALGYSAGQLVGHKPAEFLIDQPGVDGFIPFGASQPVEGVEIWMRRADGSPACLLASSSPMLDAQGSRRGARGVWQDVTHERERDAAFSKANNRERVLSYIVRTIRDEVDPGDMLRKAAEATSLAFGAAAGQIYRRLDGQFSLAVAFGHGVEAMSGLEERLHTDSFEAVVTGRPVLGALSRYRQEANGAVLIWRRPGDPPWNEDDRLLLEDIADQIGIAHEQIINHERIVALSRTDALTGLFNRRAFFEEITERFTRSAHHGKPAALIYVDLDNFKAVNDHRGHMRGDEALVEVRKIMIAHTRPVDLVARLGGDEFAVWLEGADAAFALARCEEIIRAADQLLQYSGTPEVPLTLSMGIAVHDPLQIETLSELLQRADEAMYSAKHNGKCSFRLARPAGAGIFDEALG